MKIYLYKITNMVTNDVIVGLRGSDVKKLLGCKSQVSAIAERENPVVGDWLIEKTGESTMTELNPFTKETYFEWIYWCNIINGRWKMVS